MDVLEVVAPIRRRGVGADAVPGEQRGGDALRVRLRLRGDVGGQGQPGGEDFVDAPAKRPPIALRDIEVPSQVEQGALPDLVADALGAHEAEGEVPAVGAGTGASDEHDPKMAGRGAAHKASNAFFGTTFLSPTTKTSICRQKSAEIREIGTNPLPIPAPSGKDG